MYKYRHRPFRKYCFTSFNLLLVNNRTELQNSNHSPCAHFFSFLLPFWGRGEFNLACERRPISSCFRKLSSTLCSREKQQGGRYIWSYFIWTVDGVWTSTVPNSSYVTHFGMHSSCLLLGVVTRDICSLNRIKNSIKNTKSGYQFKSRWCFHHCFSFWQTKLWWLLAVVAAISGKIFKRGERKRKNIWPTLLQ